MDREDLILEHERLDDLQNGYMLIQNPKQFCFGLDAVLLSWFANVKPEEKVLDMGTGTGIVPILLKARYPQGKYTGLEIQEESADVARRSVAYNHLEQDISLEDLAKTFYVSKFHIAHLFKENTGIAIHQYIMKKRLAACQDAILGNISISRAYLMFGFKDYSSFYRAFKKEFGISPKEYKDLKIQIGMKEEKLPH